jgi:hypothetical protein
MGFDYFLSNIIRDFCIICEPGQKNQQPSTLKSEEVIGLFWFPLFFNVYEQETIIQQMIWYNVIEMKSMKIIKSLDYIREMFRDLPTRAATAVLVMIMALVIFNIVTDIPDKHPLIAIFTFSLVPILFVLGGIFFTVAILKNRCK